MDLTTLSFNEKQDRAKKLAESLAIAAKEKDFSTIAEFLSNISLLRLIDAWAIADKLKGIVPSHRAEVLKDAHGILWKNQKGF